MGILYYNDIYALHIDEEKPMVLTSKMDKQKRVLVDVFIENGKYVDCYYLEIPGLSRPDALRRKPICFHQGSFWTSFSDEDDNPVIIKHKINSLTRLHIFFTFNLFYQIAE